MHPGCYQNKRLLLDPCNLMFRNIVSAFVCTLPVLKSTEKASALWNTIIFKIAGMQNSLERKVNLSDITFLLTELEIHTRKYLF